MAFFDNDFAETRLMRTILPIMTGSLGITYPAWASLIEVGWQVLIAVMGGVVLALTIYGKVLEIRAKRIALRKLEGGDNA